MSTPESTSGRGNLARTLVVSVAVVAVLLLGAAVGLLIKLPNSEPSYPAADSVDVGFCQDMSTHHLQAVQMSNIARDKSTDPAVKTLAFDIASTQLEQTGRMKGWLMLWSQPEQSNSGEHMKWMAGSGGHAHSTGTSDDHTVTLMPGMATSADLAKLRSLTGKDLDVYYLQLMLRHHLGGAPMADYARQHAGQHVVQTLADNMLKGQSHEIDLMKSMLSERGAQPL